MACLYSKIEELCCACLPTPLGVMVAIADAKRLRVLAFQDMWEETMGMEIPSGMNPVLALLQEELQGYFEGKLRVFTTPRMGFGTPFRQKVWAALEKVPYGQTASYAKVASKIGQPNAHRAVAQANKNNPLAILVPCHRIIYSGGALGGYASGLERKQWLIQHEQRG